MGKKKKKKFLDQPPGMEAERSQISQQNTPSWDLEYWADDTKMKSCKQLTQTLSSGGIQTCLGWWLLWFLLP